MIMCLEITHSHITPTKAYKIYTTHPHNFFAYDQAILVHNFMPFIGLGATWLFGGGALEFGGLSIVASIASLVLGVTFFKKQAKPINSFHVTSNYGGSCGGAGKDPNDDEDNTQQKNGRKHNTIDKTTFFKNVKNNYRHWRDGIYKRNHKTKGLGKKAEYLRWNHLHNDVEAFDHGGDHVGSYDPQTLQLYKPPKPLHRIEI